MMNKKDLTILRELAKRYAEIATLPVQKEKRILWLKLNSLKPERPMVMINQVCWNEVNTNGELNLQCTDPECCKYEEFFRKILYQWEHFPVDMVVEPFIRVPKAIITTGFGLEIQEEIAITDPENAVVGHSYKNQFQNKDDLEKLHLPRITHDASETERRLTVAHELFDGLLEIRLSGWETSPGISLWDTIVTWMGIDHALYALIDKPDFMHRLVGRLTDCYLSMLDQLEEKCLICGQQSLVHCTGAYTDELPASGYDPNKFRTRDIWMYGLAQMFCTVSPEMFKEFEVDYVSRICSRFGLVYYGCCDPLDLKMNEVRMIPNVRKVSMSPWVNQERGAAGICNNFVFSRKFNPAILASNHFDTDQVMTDLHKTIRVCNKFTCPLEIILKDISTIHNEPERLSEWARIAMKMVGA